MQCGQCNNACPLNLPAQNMLHWVEHDQHAPQRDDTLLRCVECGLCDRACPSNIPLANLFGQAIQSVQQMRTDARQKDYLKDRFAAHNARLAAKAESAASKRQQRLDRSKQGAAPWQQSS
ncbi:MAG: 4Fe-4S dicluster domain-containing protein [Pseudomonadota bacterium]